LTILSYRFCLSMVTIRGNHPYFAQTGRNGTCTWKSANGDFGKGEALDGNCRAERVAL
jgi:hypothetical protein